MPKGAYKQVEKDLYRQFLAYPKSERGHIFKDESGRGLTTDTDFANAYDLNLSTLYRWTKDPVFRRGVDDLRRARSSQATSDVIEALKDSALAGNVHAIRMFMDYLGEYAPDQSENTAVGGDEIDSVFATSEFRSYFSNELASEIVKLDGVEIKESWLANQISKLVESMLSPKGAATDA